MGWGLSVHWCLGRCVFWSSAGWCLLACCSAFTWHCPWELLVASPPVIVGLGEWAAFHHHEGSSEGSDFRSVPPQWGTAPCWPHSPEGNWYLRQLSAANNNLLFNGVYFSFCFQWRTSGITFIYEGILSVFWTVISQFCFLQSWLVSKNFSIFFSDGEDILLPVVYSSLCLITSRIYSCMIYFTYYFMTFGVEREHIFDIPS